MNMIVKKLKPFLAPLKVQFVDPDTGHKYTAKTRTELVQKIVNYRAQNELEPIENLNLVLENYFCSLPENKHLCEVTALGRGFMGYVKGAVTIVYNMLLKNYVSQEEADRRASICIQCPHNVFPISKDAFMSWSDELSYHTLGDRKTQFDNELGSCDVCTCPLRTKIWNGEVVRESDETNAKFPDFCWNKRI